MDKGVLNHRPRAPALTPPEICRIARAYDTLVSVSRKNINESPGPLPRLQDHIVADLKEILITLGNGKVKELVPRPRRSMLTPRDDMNPESTFPQVIYISQKEGVVIVDRQIDLIGILGRLSRLKSRKEGPDQITILESLPRLIPTANGYEDRNPRRTHASRL
jgi:hypothetical protein